MRILVICQYYFPEPFRIHDLCEEMVQRGHEVMVVTGEPNYPEGEIYKGYENHKHQDEVIKGVTVHRCPIIPRKTGTLYRILNYLSYPYYAKRYVKNLMASDGRVFDVILVNQLSPIMMAEPGVKYGKRYRVPIMLYCLDLWPESLVAGGMSRGSFIYKVFHKISKRIYRSVDKILITSKSFGNYLEEQFEINTEKIEYLPQYAEDLFEPLPYKEPKDVIDLVFAGNIGEVQSVDTIISAAKKLREKAVHFHVVGGGTDLERVKRLADGFDNVTFYGRCSLEEMPRFYAKADAMIVTLKADPVLSLTLPGKVQSYMAVGKPIIGAIDGETARVIKDARCGYCAEAENSNELVKCINSFIKSKDKKKMGMNARRYYELHFDRKRFMDVLETNLATIRQTKRK